MARAQVTAVTALRAARACRIRRRRDGKRNTGESVGLADGCGSGVMRSESPSCANKSRMRERYGARRWLPRPPVIQCDG